MTNRPVLTFDAAIPAKALAKIRDNLSAIVVDGEHLWLGGDEGTMLDRLAIDANGNFNQHQRTDLSRFFVLVKDSNGKVPEIDIEGLDLDGGYLWVAGSHSLKRSKPDVAMSAEENRQRMEITISERNRHTIARVPLDAAGNLSSAVGGLTAARLDGDVAGDQLTHALSADPLLGDFCSIPSKENGLDIEGLAVTGHRVFLGLRGPVLRGWAVIVEFLLKDSGAGVLSIDGGKIRKHFLQLNGLGVRDLAILDKDLYVLAGPTMDLDGPVFIFRWSNALDSTTEAFVWQDEKKEVLAKVLEVPFGQGEFAGRDHAEGLALIARPGGGIAAMICYDSPAAPRLDKDHPERVLLDVFDIADASMSATASGSAP